MRISSKDKIVEKASELFHLQGYNSTGINQIIDKTGIAKATLYKHFESKEHLAIAYLSTRHSYWMASLSEYVAKGKNEKEKLLLAFDFIAYMNNKENYKGCCFLNMLAEIQPENQKTIYAQIKGHKNDLLFFLSSLIERNNDILQKHIYILYEGTLIETQLQKDNWAVETAKKIISTIIS